MGWARGAASADRREGVCQTTKQNDVEWVSRQTNSVDQGYTGPKVAPVLFAKPIDVFPDPMGSSGQT